jgi:alpha-N-arabinofuranosidase
MPARVHRFSVAVALVLLAAFSASAQQTTSIAPRRVTLTIDDGAAKAASSPTLYGLMTEEINHSYDGGLYAELIRDRAIRHGGWGQLDHWRLVQRGIAQANLEIDGKTGPSTALPGSLKLTITSANASSPAGVANSGWWGIPLHPRTDYQASFWAKASVAGADVTAALIDDDSGRILTQQTVHGIGTTWQRYRTTLRTPASLTPSAHNHFALLVTQPGTLWLNLVSLFPPTYNNTPNGNRIDLMQRMAAMHPAFLRFPGGNYLEGNTIAQRFRWKQTIGPLVDRPTHMSPWGYRSSDGMGLLEFLNWCQDLHMQPVLAVYAGYSLNGEHVAAGPALQPYVQSALEEIEYVTGSRSTQWGAQRAKDGHPAPFPLRYVEIGNEDQFDKSGSYSGRYAQFYDAIHQKYPGLQIIATAPVTGHKVDVLDEHYYESPQQFFAMADHYDKLPRTGPKIFVGEWATMEGSPTPDFGAALSDAAWMTGLERNSDLVVMASYAPLLTNVNPMGPQWVPNLIGYDAMSSYGSPSYWAQVLFSKYRGDEILASTMSGSPLRIFASVTREKSTGTIDLKLVNANTVASTVQIHLDHAAQPPASGMQYILSAPSTTATNTISDPEHIVPRQKRLPKVGRDFSLTLEPLSINVITLHAKGK